MDIIHLEDIPFDFDPAVLAEELHIAPGSDDMCQFGKMADHARNIGRPKAAFGIAFINGRDGDRITLEKTVFTSRIMQVNLQTAGKCVPYIATCGTELEQWAAGITDMLENYWADAIKETALRSALTFLDETVHARTGWKKTSSMNPGSLPDWPLEQQRELFSLLEDGSCRTGVTLTESCLMLPNKSVSGIRFAAESDFVSCLLCPRETCERRRAPHDPALAAERYRL